MRRSSKSLLLTFAFFSNFRLLLCLISFGQTRFRHGCNICKIEKSFQSVTSSLLLRPSKALRSQRNKKKDRRFLQYITLNFILLNQLANPVYSAGDNDIFLFENDKTKQGISIVTQSDLGKLTRRATIGAARVADKLDEKWERFSDSLRDKNQCDVNTNRKLYDNGFRRDGTRVGNPVLGNLCKPIPLKPFVEGVGDTILQCSKDTAVKIMTKMDYDISSHLIEAKEKEIEQLVAPVFLRSSVPISSSDDPDQSLTRQAYNKKNYVTIKALSNILYPKDAVNLDKAKDKDLIDSIRMNKNIASQFELFWGEAIIRSSNERGILPSNVDLMSRKMYFTSPFPKLSVDEKVDVNYNENSLLEALGTISLSLGVLQDAGIIGNWEISIPVDDLGEVVTIAVDDDISLGSQILLKEQQQNQQKSIPLGGSAVVAIVRASFERSGIKCSVDSFFLDPSTTKQDVYNPTQLLINLSNIENK